MSATTIFLSEWKTGLFAPSGLLSGYSGGELPAHPLLEVFGDPSARGAVYEVSGSINLAGLTNKRVQAMYCFCHPLSGSIGGVANLRVETGQTQGAGTAFTILTPESVFSGVDVYEVKVWPEFGRFEFNPLAIANLAITWITISGNTDGLANPARVLGEVIEQVLAVLSGGGGGSLSWVNYIDLEAAENLAVDSTVFMAAGEAYQFDDAAQLAQGTRGWVTEAYSMGATARVYFAGVMDKPSAIAALPTDRDLFASPGGSLTWDGDPTDPLGSGDFFFPMGRSWNETQFILNATTPAVGRKP